MKKKEMIPLSEEENKFYEEQDVCYICKKSFVGMKTMKMTIIKMKSIEKLKIMVITLENLEEVPIIFVI